MSRITIDDCLVNCPNHFELAYHSAKRAQQIVRRADALVPEGDDKAIVVALREVARGALQAGALSADDNHAAAEVADGENAAAEDNATAAADGDNVAAAEDGDNAAATTAAAEDDKLAAPAAE